MIRELIALLVLAIASFTDIKTREVPDWLSYGLIATGFAVNVLYSIIFSDINFIINSVIGFLIFLGFGYLMFYTGQWGGGDSKVVMGLGALFGLNIFGFRIHSLPFMAVFWINLLLVSVFYAFLWSLVIAIRNRKKFLKAFKEQRRRFFWLRALALISIVIVFIVLFFVPDPILRIMMSIIIISFIVLFYLSLFMKAVEKSCMIKLVPPEKLTEGDWIAKEVKVDGKYICGPKDLGITKKQIKKLLLLKKKKKINKILLKEGIPFVPSFLIAYLVSLFFGSWFLAFL